MAVRFDTSGQWYTRSVTGPTTWTACLWMYQVNVRGGPFGYGKPNAGGSTVFLSGGATLKCFDLGSNGSGFGNLPVSANSWYRIAVSVNGANCSWYHGGATGTLTVASVTNIQSPVGAGQSWFLGNDSFDGGWLDGRLAAVKIWSAELSPAEIDNELGQYLPRRTANLVQWHPLLVAETVDYSGNGNTLSGGAGATTEDGPPIPWGSAVPLIFLPTSAQPVVLDQAVESDTAGTITPVVVIDQATESTSAGLIAPVQIVAVGQAAESNTAGTMTPPSTGAWPPKAGAVTVTGVATSTVTVT